MCLSLYGKEEDIKLTGAKKGTLLHLCLQKLEESKDYNEKVIEELIESLVQKEIITKKEAEAINRKAILQFTKSNIWQEMKKAKEVQKENKEIMI